MSEEGPRRSRHVPKSVEALNAATRGYDDAVWPSGASLTPWNGCDCSCRSSRRFRVLMISRPFGHTLEFFPELILNLCQGNASSIELARNLIRTLPKSEVERRMVADLESLVDGMIADEVAQLSDLLIELGLSAAVARVAAYAAAQPDDEMRRLAEHLEGVEGDTSRWRLSRTEQIHH